jgi:hypothetical protein
MIPLADVRTTKFKEPLDSLESPCTRAQYEGRVAVFIALIDARRAIGQEPLDGRQVAYKRSIQESGHDSWLPEKE